MNTLLHVQSPYTQPRLKTMPLREQPAYRVTQDATACNQTELLAALIGGAKPILVESGSFTALIMPMMVEGSRDPFPEDEAIAITLPEMAMA